MIFGFAQDQAGALAGRENVLFQVLQVNRTPQRVGAVVSGLLRQARIAVKVRSRVTESGIAQPHEPGHVPMFDHLWIGIDENRKIKEVRYERDCFAALRNMNKAM